VGTAIPLVGPGSGRARAVSVRPGPDPRGAMSDFLAFAGAPGERNLVGLRAIVDAVPGGFSWLVDDAGAPLVAGVGCVSLDVHTARCEEAADLTSSLPLASVALGDMDDNLTRECR
jgi:hypothetical protein